MHKKTLHFFVTAAYFFVTFFYFASAQPAQDPYFKERHDMVKYQIKLRGIKDERVLKAMEKVPRHLYVPKKYIRQAYGDFPLPIGEGQTISQPYIVALMTELLELKGNEKVLEIGTGSGYHASVIREITDKVYSIEIIPALAEGAKKRLEELGYADIQIKIDDGYYGWKENAPFDRIIVTAAPDHTPNPLVRQLKDGGIMIIPVGPAGATQTLWQIKKKDDELIMNNITAVQFVPLVRK